MWMCCEMSANFIWNMCEKSRIPVGNIIIAFGHCSNIVRLMYEFCSVMLWNICKFCLKYMWKVYDSCWKCSHCIWTLLHYCSINLWNVCEFCSNFHLKRIRNNIIKKSVWKCDYIVVITQHIKTNVITNYNSTVVSHPDPFRRNWEESGNMP